MQDPTAEGGRVWGEIRIVVEDLVTPAILATVTKGTLGSSPEARVCLRRRVAHKDARGTRGTSSMAREGFTKRMGEIPERT